MEHGKLLDKHYLSKQKIIGGGDFLSHVKNLDYSVKLTSVEESNDLYIKWERFIETNINKTNHEKYLQRIIPFFLKRLELLDNKKVSLFEFEFSPDCLYSLHLVEKTEEFLIAIRFYDVRKYKYTSEEWAKIWTQNNFK